MFLTYHGLCRIISSHLHIYYGQFLMLFLHSMSRQVKGDLPYVFYSAFSLLSESNYKYDVSKLVPSKNRVTRSVGPRKVNEKKVEERIV